MNGLRGVFLITKNDFLKELIFRTLNVFSVSLENKSVIEILYKIWELINS